MTQYTGSPVPGVAGRLPRPRDPAGHQVASPQSPKVYGGLTHGGAQHSHARSGEQGARQTAHLLTPRRLQALQLGPDI